MKIKKELEYKLEYFRNKSIAEIIDLVNWASIYDYLVFLLSFPLVVNFFSGLENEGLSTNFIIKNTVVYFFIAIGLREWCKSESKLIQTFSLESIQGLCLFILLSFAVFYPFMLLLSQREVLPMFVPILHGLLTIILLLVPRLINQIKVWQLSSNKNSETVACLFMLDSKFAQEIYDNWNLYELPEYSLVAVSQLADNDLKKTITLPIIQYETVNSFIQELQLLEEKPERIIIDPKAYDISFIRRLFRQLSNIGISVLKLSEDPISGTITIKPLSAYDLLSSFDDFAYSSTYTDRVVCVYVSGAGISSDIVRFLARSGASNIILLGAYEHALDLSEQTIKNEDWHGKVYSYLINGLDIAKISKILNQHNPEYMFHAAGTEAIRFSEQNPTYSYKMNFWVAHVLSQSALINGVSNFIYLDTNPHKNSIQNAIISYLLSQNELQDKIKFFVVDINICVNNGSHVLANILNEIDHGGPVHVPHKEHMEIISNIDRLFCKLSNVMSLPASKERVYMLDGGKPLRIYDLVEDAIRLKGLKPSLDIEVLFTGATEQSSLFTSMHNRNGQTSIPGLDDIFYRIHKTPDYGLVQKAIANFERYISAGDIDGIEKIIQDLDPKSDKESMAA